jgi:hypothetical protein
VHTPTSIGAARDARAQCGLRYHFSVDDVFDAFIDVSDAKLPLFAHPLFALLKRLHDKFGTTSHLYLFYRKAVDGSWRTLEEVSDSVGDALRQNQWLQLGPHGLDYDTPPYAQTPDEQNRVFDLIYTQFERFAPGAARSPWVRLHYFSEAYESAPYFRARGVQALLTTDRAVVGHRIPRPVRERLKEHGQLDYGGITLIRSHFRMERLVADGLEVRGMKKAVDSVLRKHGLVVLMTHECEIERPDVREMTFTVLDHLAAIGATST